MGFLILSGLEKEHLPKSEEHCSLLARAQSRQGCCVDEDRCREDGHGQHDVEEALYPFSRSLDEEIVVRIVANPQIPCRSALSTSQI